jgi:hypothetical protein
MRNAARVHALASPSRSLKTEGLQAFLAHARSGSLARSSPSAWVQARHGACLHRLLTVSGGRRVTLVQRTTEG